MQIGNIEAIDRALGKHLNACPWDTRISDIADFNTRTGKDRIYRGDNEDVESFLKNMAKAVPDPVSLPIVSYFKERGLGVDAEDFKDVSAELRTTDELRQYNIEYQNYHLTYNICVIGHGSNSTYELGLPLHRYLQNNPVFYIWYLTYIDQAENRAAKFRLPATIMEPVNIAFDDVTPKKDNITQIHALSAKYEIKAPMIFVDQVAPVDIEVEFMPIISFGT